MFAKCKAFYELHVTINYKQFKTCLWDALFVHIEFNHISKPILKLLFIGASVIQVKPPYHCLINYQTTYFTLFAMHNNQ